MSAVEGASARAPDGYGDVFIPQDESDASLGALSYADRLGAHFGAQVSGLMIGFVPYYPMALGSAANPEGWMQAQRQANDEASATELRLRAIYARLISANELKRVDAFEQEGARICARRARLADLTVMGWSPSDGGDFERAVFEACLFESGRPVLLTPPHKTFRAPPLRVVVAWNGSREAARAVREALPILREARLTRIVAVDSEDAEDGGFEDVSAQLARRLQRHGVAVEAKRTHSAGRSVIEALAEEIEQFGAGLIVLGGYGHMRAGQWIYGGVTRAAIAQLKTPMMFAY